MSMMRLLRRTMQWRRQQLLTVLIIVNSPNLDAESRSREEGRKEGWLVLCIGGTNMPFFAQGLVSLLMAVGGVYFALFQQFIEAVQFVGWTTLSRLNAACFAWREKQDVPTHAADGNVRETI
jgi:hypothetical protein